MLSFSVSGFVLGLSCATLTYFIPSKYSLVAPVRVYDCGVIIMMAFK